jgi:hypothetical protein
MSDSSHPIKLMQSDSYLEHQPPTTMFCYCSKCYPSIEQSKKTIKCHLKADQDQLTSGIVHTDLYIKHIQECIDKTKDSLKGLIGLATGLYIMLLYI